VKESGLGREGGAEGLDEYLQTKYICLGAIDAWSITSRPRGPTEWAWSEWPHTFILHRMDS